MAELPNEWNDLKVLQPFFDSYLRRFVAHFCKNYKEIHMIDLDRSGRQAAGHAFLRHFIPSFKNKPLPGMNTEVEERYQQLLQEQKAFSLTILDMTQDLMIFQNQATARQMSAFQKFLSRNLPSAGAITPPQPEEVEAAASEVVGAQSLTPILDMLAKIQQGQGTLKTLNLYEDVPVTNDAQVLELLPERNQVRVSLNRYQAIIVKSEGHTFFKSPGLLPGMVKAYLVSMDPHEPKAVFGRFHLASPRYARRENMRVRPALPIKLEVRYGNDRASGTLMDISMQGMGLELKRGEMLAVDTDVAVDLFLPPSNEFTLKGVVAGFRKTDTGSAMVGVKIFPGKREEGIITDYIRDRQREVLQGLKQKADRDAIRLPTFDKARKTGEYGQSASVPPTS